MAERTNDDPRRGAMKPVDPEHPPLRVWLAVTRLSNLPTVFSNVLTGLMLGYMAGALAFGLPGPPPADHVLLWRIITEGGWLLLLAGACLYMAGMTLNDVLDRHHDRLHRPERPIPAGHLRTRTAVVAVIAFTLVGLLLVMRFGPAATAFALALTAAMVGYNALHRRFPAAALLMGVVRALLYLTAATAIMPTLNASFARVALPFAVILAAYVTIVTYLARRENDAAAGRRAMLAWALPVLALAGMLSVVPNTPTMIALAAAVGLALLLWLGRCAQQVTAAQPQTQQAVMNWLAGLCLIDAYFLALMGRPAFVGAALVCFVATIIAQRRVMGT